MIICIIGKTSSGKDTVAKLIKDKYGISMVVSYSTAPKRKDQVEGVHHYFIDNAQMDEILKTQSVIAYTKNMTTGTRYCATLEALKSDPAVYIIDPAGVEYLGKTNICPFVTIYVDCTEDNIIERGTLRGDGFMRLTTRLISEREDFDGYRDKKSYDYLIDNNGTYDQLVSQVEKIMNGILKKHTSSLQSKTIQTEYAVEINDQNSFVKRLKEFSNCQLPIT